MSNNKNSIEMKTYYFSLQKNILRSFVGILGLVVSSCGSYQNKS
ncbi:MAG: hypothetical protein RLZZ546_3031, partial [Bacteroidota bacterium]